MKVIGDPQVGHLPILRCAPDKPSLFRLLSKAPYNLTLLISSFTSYQGLNCFLASSSRFQLWPQSILSDVMGKPYPVLPPYFLLLGEFLSIPQSPVQAALDISTVVMLSCILIFYHLFFHHWPLYPSTSDCLSFLLHFPV